jgi:hypothetical protein
VKIVQPFDPKVSRRFLRFTVAPTLCSAQPVEPPQQAPREDRGAIAFLKPLHPSNSASDDPEIAFVTVDRATVHPPGYFG